jgi:Flp pilus assembly protein protease CpaA
MVNFGIRQGQIEQRIDDITDHAKHIALSTAVIIALSIFAGLFCTMAIGVGLIMLYRAEAATYGEDTALAVIGAVLVAAAVILLIVAFMVGRSLSRKRASGDRRDLSAQAMVPRGTAGYY